MVHILPVSEARRRLPSLLKAIQKDPTLLFQIRVRDETIATLSSCQKVPKTGSAVEALLRLVKKQKHSRKPNSYEINSENFKEFLYRES